MKSTCTVVETGQQLTDLSKAVFHIVCSNCTEKRKWSRSDKE
jgi:hypothetical protein